MCLYECEYARVAHSNEIDALNAQMTKMTCWLIANFSILHRCHHKWVQNFSREKCAHFDIYFEQNVIVICIEKLKLNICLNWQSKETKRKKKLKFRYIFLMKETFCVGVSANSTETKR